MPITECYHKFDIGKTIFYKWQDKYGCMENSDIKCLKKLEAENRKLCKHPHS
ncbi:transposase [Gilliamella sp. App4-10]|uniref:transposase n=1 Tax=Gilliamella sp. App4-10 TaxID=3120231 RepID=UPI003FA5DA5F